MIAKNGYIRFITLNSSSYDRPSHSPLPTLLQRHSSNHVLIHSLKQMAQHVAHGNTHRVYSNTALSVRIGVQQRTLNGEGGHVQYALQGDLQNDRGISMANRHRHQVVVGDREVAVEPGHLGALGDTHAVDGLKAGFSGEVVENITVEGFSLRTVLVEGGVEEKLSARDSAQRGERGHIGVLCSAKEEVYGDLLFAENGSELAVEGGSRLKKILFGVAAERHGVFAHLELTCAIGRHGCLEMR